MAGEKLDKYPEGQETEALTLDGRKVKVTETLYLQTSLCGEVMYGLWEIMP